MDTDALGRLDVGYAIHIDEVRDCSLHRAGETCDLCFHGY